jgi:hypothetical protein
MWLTLIWHIGQQVPWCWKTGPSGTAENFARDFNGFAARVFV